MDILKIYIKDINKHARETQREASTRESQIAGLLPLGVFIARKFTGCGVDLEDLIQIANIEILETVNKFDESLGVKLSTYAYQRIRGSLLKEINRGGLVRKPERAERVRFRELKTHHRRHYKKLSTPKPLLPKETPQQQAQELLNLLSEDLRFIIKQRLQGYTRRKIAKELKVSGELIRQREIKAMQIMCEAAGVPYQGQVLNLKNKIGDRKNGRFVTAFGETKLLITWARDFKMNHNTLSYRLQAGYTPEEALTLSEHEVRSRAKKQKTLPGKSNDL